MRTLLLLAIAFTLACASPRAAGAQSDLGDAAAFVLLAGGDVTSTGATQIAGSVGAEGTVTGFPPGEIGGGQVVEDVAQALADASTAGGELASLPCDVDISAEQIGGATLAPGVYCASGDLEIDGAVTLSGPGDGTWVIQVGGNLTVMAGSSIRSVHGAAVGWCRTAWTVAGAASIPGADAQGFGFLGTIIAGGDVSLASGAALAGRAISLEGDVTVDAGQGSIYATCEAPPDGNGPMCDVGIDETAEPVTTTVETPHFTIQTTCTTRVITR